MYFIYTYVCMYIYVCMYVHMYVRIMYVCGFLGTSSPNTTWNYVKINKKFQKSEKI